MCVVHLNHVLYGVGVVCCREVIEKRPFEFKIECLQQVRALFPEDYCPLHAGFGNRHSVSYTYREGEREIFTRRLDMENLFFNKQHINLSMASIRIYMAVLYILQYRC